MAEKTISHVKHRITDLVFDVDARGETVEFTGKATLVDQVPRESSKQSVCPACQQTRQVLPALVDQ